MVLLAPDASAALRTAGPMAMQNRAGDIAQPCDNPLVAVSCVPSLSRTAGPFSPLVG
jgi:hypothetical protein